MSEAERGEIMDAAAVRLHGLIAQGAGRDAVTDVLREFDRAGWITRSVSSHLVPDLASDLNSAGRILGVGGHQFDSYWSNLAAKAYRCADGLRARLETEHREAVDRQRIRLDQIFKVSYRISEARKLLDDVARIPDEHHMLGSEPPVSLDAEEAKGKDDAELDSIISSAEGRILRADEQYSRYVTAANNIQGAFGDECAEHVKMLRELSTERANSADQSRTAISVARAELEARAKAREEARRANEPAKVADVEALVARVAELESQVGANR